LLNQQQLDKDHGSLLFFFRSFYNSYNEKRTKGNHHVEGQVEEAVEREPADGHHDRRFGSYGYRKAADVCDRSAERPHLEDGSQPQGVPEVGTQEEVQSRISFFFERNEPMKRALASAGVAATILATSAIGGCTQKQRDYFFGRVAEVAATETVQDDQELAEFYDALPDNPDTPCGEWFWTAIEAGWTVEQWPFLSQTMWAESRCSPTAKSPAGARGLMQEMPFWAANCGITVEMLYDPAENLKCALVTLNAQGKSAWDGWDGRS
jgi:Transglycosylase SLT domain